MTQQNYSDYIISFVKDRSPREIKEFLRNEWKEIALKIYNSSYTEWFFKPSDSNIGVKQYAKFLICIRGNFVAYYYDEDIKWGVNEEQFNMIIDLRKNPKDAIKIIEYYSKYVLDLDNLVIDVFPYHYRMANLLPITMQAKIEQARRDKKIMGIC